MFRLTGRTLSKAILKNSDLRCRLLMLPMMRFTEQPQKPERPRLSKQDLSAAHKKFTDELMSKTEDANSFEREGVKLPHTIGAGMIALMFGFLFSYLQSRGNSGKDDEETKKEYYGVLEKRPTAELGGQWSLIDTEGNSVSSRDLRGTYYVMYFGFARCPDICPNFLSRMSHAMRILRQIPESRYLKLKVLFVSIDPEKDSPQRLQKFINFFDPAIIGLSGTSNDDFMLKDCMSKFKVYGNKIYTDHQKDNYTIDHTSLGYLMDDENKLALIIGPNLNGEQIAKAIADDALARNYTRSKKVKK